jgi:hypothetical protein
MGITPRQRELFISTEAHQMKIHKIAAFSIALGLMTAMAGTASAVETGTGTISQTSLGGGNFQYNLTLTNTSTDLTATGDIGTFWFAWVPGVDFMEIDPTSITEPAGWTPHITGSNASNAVGDGNAIQFLANSSATYLLPGQTDDFSFDSTESLAQLQGPSSYGAHNVETTSFLYHQGIFSDNGDEITLSTVSVPEPVSASLFAVGGLGLLMRRRRA